MTMSMTTAGSSGGASGSAPAARSKPLPYNDDARCPRPGRRYPQRRLLPRSVKHAAGPGPLALQLCPPSRRRQDDAEAHPDRARATTPLSPPMSTDWESNAVCHLIFNYSAPEANGCPGNLEFLPDLYRQLSGIPYVHDAYQAAALASLGSRNKAAQLLVDASASYGRALSGFIGALSNEEEARSDGVLGTSILLALYETVTSHRTVTGHGTAMQQIHSQNNATLLRLRRPTADKSPLRTSLSRIVHWRTQFTNVTMPNGTSKELDEEFEAAYKDPYARRFANLICQASQARSRVRLTREDHLKGRISRVSLLFEVQQLCTIDQKLQSWSDWSPRDWKYRCVSKFQFAAAPYPTRVYVFNGLQHMTIWLAYFCMRLHIQDSILECANVLSEVEMLVSRLPSRARLDQTRLELANDICCTTPYSLGDIDETGAPRVSTPGLAMWSLQTIWSLHIAGSVVHLPLDLQVWIQDQLLRVGRRWGIRQAFMLHDIRLSQHPELRERCRVDVIECIDEP